MATHNNYTCFTRENLSMSELIDQAFPSAVSDRICNHMNKDHADAVLVYAQAFGQCPQAIAAEMVSIDAMGMSLNAQTESEPVALRIPFDPPLKDAKEAHHVLVEMLKGVHQPDSTD
jgi:putative heme iron utilization protein